MSERAREPVFFEDAEEEPEPEPATGSSGSGGTPTAVGSGLGDDGDDEPPIEIRTVRGDDPRDQSSTMKRRLGAASRLLHQVYSLPIEDLGLSLRAYNVLRRSGLITVEQVLKKTEEELVSLRNFGRQSYDELRHKLDEIGILPVERD